MTRIEKLLKYIDRNQACLVTQPIDIFYLTGMDVSLGTLIISHEMLALLVDGRYFEACKKDCRIPVFLAKEGLLFELIKGAETLVIDQDNTSHAAFLKWSDSAKNAGIKILPKENLVKHLRIIKDSSEIDLLKKASSLGLEGFHFVKSLLKPGIKERDIAAELEYFWRKKGSEGTAFDPIIAFGANSAMPHYRACEAILKDGDIVLIDIGVKKEHYHSDMTRVIFFGTPDPRLKTVHSIVEKALKAALALLKPGTLLKDLDFAAREVIAKAGYEGFFTHSLGHGIGLEVHESPFLKAQDPYGNVRLQEGMAITIEPGIYLPGIGGVRLEDTVILTKSGFLNLTELDYA